MTPPQSLRQMTGESPSTVSLSSSSNPTALIVIDAQGSYDNGAPLAISGVDDAQKKIAGLVGRYREAGSPVIWVQHLAGSGAPIFNPDDATYDFIGDVRPKGNEKVIVKQNPSSFTGTDLQETLQALGTKQVVLTGYMAHVCVTGTARSAYELGYDTIIVRDAIGDRDIPSSDGTRVTKAEWLVDIVCDELSDAIGTVILASDVKA